MTVFMGQIMAECDCRCPACETRGYCMAARIEALEATLAEARCEIDFCNAQLEAWQRMAPPATKGLVRKRLEELKGDT